MNRLNLFRDCLLFFVIGLAFGCCGCLKAPHAETVDLSGVSRLLDAPPAETIPVPALDSDPIVTMKPGQDEPAEPAKPVGMEPATMETIYTPTPIDPPTPDLEIPRPRDPNPTQAEAVRQKFSGAVVYVKEDCQPCHYLDVDLRWLARFYDWTVAEEREAKAADFIICRRPSPNGVNPYVEFYEGGELIAKAEGYVTASAFMDRKPALIKLLKAHPARR